MSMQYVWNFNVYDVQVNLMIWLSKKNYFCVKNQHTSAIVYLKWHSIFMDFRNPFLLCTSAAVILMLTPEMHDTRTTHRCKLGDFSIICFNLVRKASFTFVAGTLPKHQMYGGWPWSNINLLNSLRSKSSHTTQKPADESVGTPFSSLVCFVGVRGKRKLRMSASQTHHMNAKLLLLQFGWN